MTPEERLLAAIAPPPNQPEEEIQFIGEFIDSSSVFTLGDMGKIDAFKERFLNKYGHYPHQCKEFHG